MSINNGSKLLAVDMDDVLVHIATPWVRRAFLRPKLRMGWMPSARFADMSDPDLQSQVLARPQSYVQRWLVEDHGFPEMLLQEFDLTYRADPTFYDNLPMTPLCEAIVAALALPGRIMHVHVVTHNYSNSDPVVSSKDRWLNKVFGGSERVSIHHLEATQKKSEKLKEVCPSPDTFADDSMKNVIDVLLNEAVKPREILIPSMAHNQLAPEITALAVLRKIDINYYDNVL
jgi:5'(3')-deoxyribonucleotidase